MSAVVVDDRLTQRDVLVVSASLVLKSRVTPTLLAAGPVLWSVGALTASDVVTRFGTTVSWLLLLVPAFALLVGMNSAYRPGSGDVYEPTRWEFSEAGVDIDQPRRPARAQWSEFAGWRRVAGRYVLYTGPRRYIVVPAHSLVAPDRAVLEELFVASLGPPRR